MIERRTMHCLAVALQNISGKTIPAEKLAACKSICEMLKEFNELYICTVTFSGIVGSTNVTSSMEVTVKDSDGNVVTPIEANKYMLNAGSYTYSATATGAVTKTDVALTITKSDEQNGTKSVTISFTAA